MSRFFEIVWFEICRLFTLMLCAIFAIGAVKYFYGSTVMDGFAGVVFSLISLAAFWVYCIVVAVAYSECGVKK